jgi:BirA family biotin operon repressor/biotin-[acetyl-CoA-carboxylase] ligase
MNLQLSATRLRSYINKVELPLRAAFWPETEAEKILRYGAIVGSVIEHHALLHRTMLHARSHISTTEESGHSVASGHTILADQVTGSKGRFTRNWHAPEGGLWGTLIYVNTLLPASRLLLPLTPGIACCEALRESGIEDATIRWINDVLVDKLKVGGFLSESFNGALSKEEYCLIGFGINVNNHQFPEELQTSATSIGLHLGRPVDLETFCYCFLAKLCWNIGLLHYHEQTSLLEDSQSREHAYHPLIKRWRELSDSVGKRVQFGFDVMTTPQYQATVTDIGEDGGLHLQLDDGSEITEYSGEIRYL